MTEKMNKRRTKRGRTDGREGFMIYLTEEEKQELLIAQAESTHSSLTGFIRAAALAQARARGADSNE